jgi:hypothetical protein
VENPSESTIIEEVASYREATTTILRDEALPLKSKCLALLRLASLAEQADGQPEWCRRIVYETAREFLGAEPVGPEVPGDAVETAARSLRARGYETCPACARRLHDELDFMRWRALRRAWLDEVRAREGAVTT